MRVLITGGGGFIGSNLADRLLERGDEVYIIDDLSTGRRDNVNEKAVFLEASIADTETVTDFFNEAKPDVVVHAAASYKDQSAWQKDIAVNVLGTANVVKNSAAHNAKRFVYFQTSVKTTRLVLSKRRTPVSVHLNQIYEVHPRDAGFVCLWMMSVLIVML